jgi:ribonuclease P protein component
VDLRSDLPDHADVVVRALPGSATVTYAELASDLRSALSAAVVRARKRGTRAGSH